MCHCDKKSKCKCVERHVIKQLPYVIAAPGQYCLAQDFTWAIGGSAAITVLNTESVVLDFHERKIVTTAASAVGVVLVSGSKDVQLENVQLEASGAAVSASRGIEIANSTDVRVRQPVLLDFNPAIKTSGGSVLVVSDFVIKTVVPVSAGQSFIIEDTNDVDLLRGSVTNGRVRFTTTTDASTGQRVTVTGLKIDNSAGIGSGARCLQLFGYNNVIISNNEMNGGGLGAATDAALVLSRQGGDYATNFLVEKNVIRSSVFSFQIQHVSGATVRDNQFKSEGKGCGFNDVNHVLTENNNVSGELVPVALSHGIFFVGDFPAGPTSFYNTVKNNFVSGFSVGYSDNHPGDTNGICTVFTNNVGTGNVANSSFLEASTVDNDNIFSCTIP